MDSIFKLFAHSVVLKILYPVALAAIIYSGVSYFRIGSLEGKVESLQQEKAKCETQLSIYSAMVDGASDQIRLAEEQCRRLLEYERNKPVPKHNPNMDDDSDVDDLVRRLLGTTDPRGKTDAPGKSSGSKSP